jgi:hypothetical protein
MKAHMLLSLPVMVSAVSNANEGEPVFGSLARTCA